MARLEPHDVAWFVSPDELRAWLAAHHSTAGELWVGMRPRSAGVPTVTWPELVDQVLCFGWIDGVRMPADGGSCIRITPRRPRSTWSARNVGRVEVLRAAGLMQPAGEAAFAARHGDRIAIYSFEGDAKLDQAAIDALVAAPGAWAFWEAQPPGYRRSAAHWVASAKRDETRARRLAALVEGCAQGERLVQLTGKPPARRS